MARRGRPATVKPSTDGARILLAELTLRSMTRRHAAAQLGIRDSRLTRIIGGEYTITLAEAVRAEALYGVPVASWARAI
jgi:plasmid maintenance system antidote protein VapI